MSQIRSKNTKPELLVRKFLFAHGFRYRLHDKKLPGKPDIVLPKYKTIIFVHGKISSLDTRRTDLGIQFISKIAVWQNAQGK